MSSTQLTLDFNDDLISQVKWFNLPNNVTSYFVSSFDGPLSEGEDINLGFAKIMELREIGHHLADNDKANFMLFSFLEDVFTKRKRIEEVLEYIDIPGYGFCRTKGPGKEFALSAIRNIVSASYKKLKVNSIPPKLLRGMIFRENILHDTFELVDCSLPEYAPIKQAMTNLNKIIEIFYNSYQPLVYKIISKYIFDKTLVEDLFSDFRQILIKAVYRYAPEFNVSFLNYATKWIKSEIFKYFKNNKEKYSKTVSYLNEENFDIVSNVESLDPNPEEELMLKDCNKILLQSLSILDERERNVVVLYYGLNTEQLNFKDIGNLLDITGERVRQINKSALRKLGLSANINTLKECA
jgi:RNA polymerase sigma factor (sigma-70 family)